MSFYPKGVRQRDWLNNYTQRFDTVEVNFTFYRMPTAKLFESWHERAPKRFTFALKGSRYITHTIRLRDAE